MLSGSQELNADPVMGLHDPAVGDAELLGAPPLLQTARSVQPSEMCSSSVLCSSNSSPVGQMNSGGRLQDIADREHCMVEGVVSSSRIGADPNSRWYQAR